MERIYMVYAANSGVKLFESQSLIDAEKFIFERERESDIPEKYEIILSTRRVN